MALRKGGISAARVYSGSLLQAHFQRHMPQTSFQARDAVQQAAVSVSTVLTLHRYTDTRIKAVIMPIFERLR
jgi:hypothetical protein